CLTIPPPESPTSRVPEVRWPEPKRPARHGRPARVAQLIAREKAGGRMLPVSPRLRAGSQRQGHTAMHADDLSSATRYPIRRHQEQTWCKACDLAPDPTVIVLWFTAGAARQRGLTHCDQCGQPVVPPTDSPDA